MSSLRCLTPTKICKNLAEMHKVFIRIRTTYVLGKIDSNAPILHEDYEAFPELIFILQISRRLLDLSEALCCFNPSGECLASGETIDALFERCKLVIYTILKNNIKLK